MMILPLNFITAILQIIKIIQDRRYRMRSLDADLDVILAFGSIFPIIFDIVFRVAVRRRHERRIDVFKIHKLMKFISGYR